MLSALTTSLKSWLSPIAATSSTNPDPVSPPILGLPNELLTRIFAQLEFREDLSRCRLVCRDFKELSSPFLITRVVFAKRVDAISRFYDVMEHPYFRKHVTELLYDASSYDRWLAGNPEEYAGARELCDRPLSAFGLEDQDQEYLSLWDRMKRLPFPTRDSDDQWPDLAEIKASKKYGGTSHWLVGYQDYDLKYQYQTRMENAVMPSFITDQALLNFPKLRSVVYGDFRNRAKYNEDYDDLCERLFGDALEPNGLCMWTSDTAEVGEREYWTDLCWLLSAIAASESSNIRSFMIGGHPYTVSPDSKISELGAYFRSIPGIPLNMGNSGIGNSLLTAGAFGAFKNVRHLQLPVEPIPPYRYDPQEWDSTCLGQKFIRQLLTSSAATLVHLQLSAVGQLPDPGWSPQLDMPEPSSVLQELVRNIRFPALKRLDLRGWIVYPDHITDLLSNISATLEELVLIHNAVWQPQRLAEWGGRNLNLRGVQCHNYDQEVGDGDIDRFANFAREPIYEDNELQESQWLSGRANTIDKITFDELRLGVRRRQTRGTRVSWNDFRL